MKKIKLELNRGELNLLLEMIVDKKINLKKNNEVKSVIKLYNIESIENKIKGKKL